MDVNKFANWLKVELKTRGWSQADLARKSGLSTGQVARLLTGERGVGERSTLAIAHALKLPPVQVFVVAGFLPEGKSDQWLEEMKVLLGHISHADRDAVKKILRTYAEMGEK